MAKKSLTPLEIPTTNRKNGRLLTGFTPLEIPIKKRGNAKFLTGFTLIELLIVVVIIGILTTLAAPMMKKMVQMASDSEAMVVINAIRKAEENYHSETNYYLVWYSASSEVWSRLGLEDYDEKGNFSYSVCQVVPPPGPVTLPVPPPPTIIRPTGNLSEYHYIKARRKDNTYMIIYWYKDPTGNNRCGDVEWISLTDGGILLGL